MIVVRVKPEWILPTLIGVGLLAAALLNAPWLTLLAIGVAYLVSLPVSMVVAWRLRRQHARESEQAAAPGPDQEHGPERVVRLGAGASPPKRDAS
jgi:CDP-diacylglycerol--serine O-phosphatidyltransferase